MSRRLQRAALVAAGLATVLAVTLAGVQPAGAQGPTVTGGGSSFASLIVNQWRADVAKPPFNVRINYSSAGSGFGRDKFISGALDFGQSDIAFLDEEIPRVKASGRGDFVYVPTVAGALAFMFNVIGTNGQRITNLRLTANDACRIFTEPDIRWNDPAIVASNPGIPLPASKVRPVVRSDRSGTSFVLSEFCIARAPAVWNAFISLIGRGNFGQDGYLAQRKPISQWPSGYGAVSQAFASDGIASAVANDSTGKDSITYIETGYTKVKRLPAAQVQNAVGVFVPPNPANSTVALGFATPNGDGTFKLSYTGADPRAYFPSTYSYAIVQTKGFDLAKGAVLATYLNYAVCKGQERAEPLLYSRLSSVLVNIALDATAKVPGAPPRPTSCAAPPPPKLITVAPGSAGAAPGSPGAAAAAGAAGAAAGAAVGAATEPAAAGTDPAATVEGVAETASGAAAAGGAAGTETAAGVAPVEGGPGGPENSEVLFLLLLGGGLLAAGGAAAKGSKDKWQTS
ncbi:MAG: substrate-binding domain-containing protein [Actinomycetes bacterium]